MQQFALLIHANWSCSRILLQEMQEGQRTWETLLETYGCDGRNVVVARVYEAVNDLWKV